MSQIGLRKPTNPRRDGLDRFASAMVEGFGLGIIGFILVRLIV